MTDALSKATVARERVTRAHSLADRLTMTEDGQGRPAAPSGEALAEAVWHLADALSAVSMAVLALAEDDAR